MKQYLSKMLALLFIFVFAFSLPGCGTIRKIASRNDELAAETPERTGYNIYYMNNEQTKIAPFAYILTETTETGIIEECLEALKAVPEDKNYKTVFVPAVNLIRYDFDKNTRTLSLFFSSDYEQISKSTEILIRAAIVKTLTQFGSIVDYVSFNIGGEWLTGDDEEVLLMNHQDFTEAITNNLENLVDAKVTLYYASENCVGLVPVSTTVKYYNNQSLATAVLETLIRGPVTEKTHATIAPRALLRGVTIKDGLCTVDFNQGFYEKLGDMAYELTVFSVVNSLVELDDIDEVMLTCYGQPVTTAPYGLDMNEPLRWFEACLYQEPERDPALDTDLYMDFDAGDEIFDEAIYDTETESEVPSESVLETGTNPEEMTETEKRTGKKKKE